MSTLTQFTGLQSEDSVASSGFLGLPILAVRNDSDAASTSANGDYSGLQTDANGRLRVNGVVNVGLTNTELRASAVPVTVSNPGLTDAQLRASAIPVTISNLQSQGLTDAQLRASPVPTFAGLPAVHYSFTKSNVNTNTTYTSSTLDMGSTSKEVIFFSMAAGAAGNLWVSISDDGSDWRRISSTASVDNGAGHACMVTLRVPARYVRAEYRNGSSSQAGFWMGASVIG